MNVPSFTVDHDKMLRGVYVSRKDFIKDNCITSFDIRLKLPNREAPLDMPAIHTMEHLLAVYLRSSDSNVANDVIYVGPMGCRTGMYLILKGDLSSKDIIGLLKNTFEYIISFKGVVPATTSIECGNYLEHNLFLAKLEAKKFYDEILCNIKDENLLYP